MSHTAPNGSDPTFAQKVIDFNTNLLFDAPLPPGISVMNPFRENACAIPASTAFYRKYYDDHRLRRIILGINPGRFGAGLTGIPFTNPQVSLYMRLLRLWAEKQPFTVTGISIPFAPWALRAMEKMAARKISTITITPTCNAPRCLSCSNHCNGNSPLASGATHVSVSEWEKMRYSLKN